MGRRFITSKVLTVAKVYAASALWFRPGFRSAAAVRVNSPVAAPGLGDRRDGVFEDQLLLGTRFQNQRELVEALDAANSFAPLTR